MTKKEAIMAMYVQALPSVLDCYLAYHQKLTYGDRRTAYRGSEAAEFITEFIVDYADEAIKQANKLENNL